MAVSKRAALAIGGIVSGAGLLVGLMMTPALAGSAPAATAASGCSATGHIDSQWGTGEILTVTVTNTSASAATTWSVSWTLAAGQQVVSGWNAVVRTSGSTVTAANASWDGKLAPGASTTFGMQLSGPVATPSPTCTNNAPSPSTTPTASTSPVTADVVVTQADDERGVTLVVGQTLEVRLNSTYQPPKTTTAGVLTQGSVTGGYPTGQPLVAQYTATAPGSTDITTVTDAACLHTPMPCPTPQVPWTLHVTVAA